VERQRLIRSLVGPESEMWDVRYLVDDRYIAAVSREGKVFFWREATGSRVLTLDLRAGPLWSFTQSADGSTLYVATSTRGILIYRREGP
jgi:WD40 repeat protein